VTPPAAAISTLQATAVTSHERVIGAIAAAGAPAGIVAGATTTMHPHPPVGPPYLTADASAPVGLTAGAAKSLDAAVAVGGPAGIVTGVAGP
jgi:hypothetical protein